MMSVTTGGNDARLRRKRDAGVGVPYSKLILAALRK